MKELLQAIQTQLRGDSNLSYIADTDIVVVEHEFFLPSTITFPAIGLKDGPILRTVEETENWDVLYTVHIIIYQAMSEGDAAIMGSPTVHGLLDIADDIHSSLNENNLGITGIWLAHSPGEGEVDINPLFEEFAVLMKKITYEYTKLEERS